MKRAAKPIGVVLILAGIALLLVGIGVVHIAALGASMKWIGWGAWAIAFGAGFLVWAYSPPKTKA